MLKNAGILKSPRKVKKSEKFTKVSPKGAPDANGRLLLAAGVPRAAPRATRNQEIYIRNIGNRKKGKEEGSNTPMGQRPGE